MKKIQDFSEKPLEYNELELPEEYRKFIKWMPKYADSICITCVGLDYSEFKQSKWSFLKDSIIDYEYTSKSPVTTGPTVLLLYLKIDHITIQWMKEKKNIYDYMDFIRDRKEYMWLYDLCLIKNKRLELCSCTHEKFCYISKGMLDGYKKVQQGELL